jgi:hypothetical protein
LHLTAAKIPFSTASKGRPALGKKVTLPFLFFSSSFFLSFFLSPKEQKTEHQSESNSETSWTPNPWKASLHHTILKKSKPFLPASQLQSCLHETAK